MREGRLREGVAAWLAVCAVTLAACWHHVQPTALGPGEPNPLIGATAFAIAPVRYEGSTVNGQPIEYFASAAGPYVYQQLIYGEQQLYNTLVMRAARSRYYQIHPLVTPPGPGVFVVQPRLVDLHVGFNYNAGFGRGMAHTTSSGTFRVQTLTSAGRLLDEFTVTSYESGASTSVRPLDRLLDSIGYSLAIDVVNRLDMLTLLERR